jgi:single-strand DNA-binding protein
MRGLNRVELIGNLGKDPEVQTLEGGQTVVKFSLATSETYKDRQGNNHTETEWHSIVLWNSLAQLAAKYLKKGSMVYLEGKLKYRSYEDKAGITRYLTEVVGDNLLMLDKKPD